jgi:enamine deaminase RidA (YjgF/YER057c/UK114 family)
MRRSAQPAATTKPDQSPFIELKSQEVMRRVELVRVRGLSDQAPYAYVATVAAVTTLIFSAGACPLDADGQVVPVGDVAGQARVTMDNLVSALAAAGATLGDIAKSTVYVASSDRADLVKAWDVVHEYMGDHDAPSTLLGVAVLGYPNQLVEVEAVAAVGSNA